MSPQWFWRSRGTSLGPMSTDELESLFRRNRIADTDQVRLAETEEWLPAAEVKGMFADSPGEASESASEAASQLLAQVDKARLKRTAAEAPPPAVLTDLVREGGRYLGGLFGSVGVWIAGSIGHVATLLGRKVILAGLVLVLIAILFKDVNFGETHNQEVFEQLSAAWAELHSLQKRGAPDTERQRLAEETLAWLQPTIATLEEAAERASAGGHYWWGPKEAETQVRQELLFAARSLRTMLKSGPDAGREHDFVNFMSSAHEFRTGTPAVTGVAPPIRPELEDGRVDPLVAGIVALDAVVVGGVLYWWWSRRWRMAG